ncbi:MAG: leucine-rich repeat protein, partial [Bacteroidaceae bacterium]|nr:leucine-rich repeat protein [Bacteroidaceae bacterium]
GMRAFCNCTSLVAFTIPNSVTSIGELAFHGCANLKTITSQIEKPFVIPAHAFSFYDSVYADATLYVPTGTVAAYRATDGWKKFGNIVEEGTTTGIDDVEAVEPDNTLDTSMRIYDINGKRLPATSLDELPSGLYIVNGKKVVR